MTESSRLTSPEGPGNVSKPAPFQTPITAEQKQAALERLLKSQTFARADQLRRFIRYVCEAEMAGRAGEITEHTIATQALGRSADYVPGDDSSVRNRAHALRLKIDEYYRQEEPGAPVRIELRKGSYVPVFHPAAAVPATAAPAPILPAPVTPPPSLPAREAARVERRGWGLGALLASALLGAAVAAGGWWLWKGAALKTPAPELAAAWGRMLIPGAPVTICVASPPTMLLKSFREGTLPAQPKLHEAPAAVQQWYAGLDMKDGGGKLHMLTTLNSVLFGDALATVRAVRLLSETGADVQVIPEWSARPVALRGRNLLLIGSPNYSPFAARILSKMPLTVWYDAEAREEVLAEELADGKAKRTFRPKRDAQGLYSQVYGLLTVLPSHGVEDGGETTAIFSGITSAGPQAAMEFYASPTHLRQLARTIGGASGAGLPRSFQVVVRAGVDRSLALNWTYEHHRVIEKLPVLD